MSKKFIPEAIHPGEFINDELEARGWSQEDLVEITGVKKTVVNELIKGKRKVTFKIARELANAFDISPKEWLELQNMYDLAKEKLR